jgi:uncharacterized protein YkwD
MRFQRRGCRRGSRRVRIKSRSGIEDAVLAKINSVRKKKGLSALLWDAEIAIGAREHSANMRKLGKLFHRRYVYRVRVENCFKGSMNQCVDSWMRSKGHRTNLLSPSIHFGAVGIAGDYATFAGW